MDLLERCRYGQATKLDYEILKTRFLSDHQHDPQWKYATECYFLNKDCKIANKKKLMTMEKVFVTRAVDFSSA